MKAFFLIFSIAFSFVAKGQDWALFPVNQKSYYAIQNDTGYVVRTFCADSVRTENGKLIVSFNAQTPLVKGGTIEDLLHFRDFRGTVRPDFVETKGDSVSIGFYSFDYVIGFDPAKTDTFLFLPNAPVGEKWNLSKTENLEITCTEATIQNVFGLADSLKRYQLKTGTGKTQEFALSKHHGLVQFCPFKELNAAEQAPARLFGFEKEDQKAGYRQPDFQDYFHFQPGDILMWRYTYQSYWPPVDSKEYRKDSILEVTEFEDEYSYRVKRISWQNKTLTDPDTITIITDKSYWNNLFYAPTEWFVFPVEEEFIHLFYTENYFVKIQGRDTISDCLFSFEGTFLDSSNFSIIGIAEYGERYSLSTQVGFKRHVYNDMASSNESVLIGSRLSGVVDGDLSFPTSAKTIVRDLPLVFPNPSHGVIQIQAASEMRLAEVFNLNGTKLRSGKINSETIDLRSLPKGIYLLRLTDKKGKTLQQKIILD